MAKLQSTFKNMALSLTLITLAAAGALAGVYMLTAEPIAAAATAKQEQALKAVLPEYDTLAEADTINGLVVRKAYMGETLAGAAVETSANGFGGVIRLMVGFDAQGNIVNYEVLEQSETPGLGTHIVEWFKNSSKEGQNIIGSCPDTRNFTVNKDGGEVDAITAATISSRAFLLAVRDAYNAYTQKTDACSGATQKCDHQCSGHCSGHCGHTDGCTGATQTTDACTGATQKIEEQVIEGAETIIENVEQLTSQSNE